MDILATSLLNFLHVAGGLKTTYRHCVNVDGGRESVADHSWRMSLWAGILRPYFPDINMDRVMAMCVVHDLGEVVHGDVPTFNKNDEDRRQEDRDLKSVLDFLPEESREYYLDLFKEMEEKVSAEARLFKVLDKLEAVLSHNEAAIESWSANEFELNRVHGAREADEFELMREFRRLLLEETDRKIEEMV